MTRTVDIQPCVGEAKYAHTVTKHTHIHAHVSLEPVSSFLLSIDGQKAAIQCLSATIPSWQRYEFVC